MFKNRRDAGCQLAKQLDHLRDRSPVVLGLPRGGVPVAAEVARYLGAPLDVLVVRKLGSPRQPELALGAVGEEGVLVLDRALLADSKISEPELQQLQRDQQELVEQRLRSLRQGRQRINLHDRTAVVVDDGVATGSTARAACTVARRLGATSVVLAVPVGPRRGLSLITEADDVICLARPDPFGTVGRHYRDFSPTSDEEVVALLTGR